MLCIALGITVYSCSDGASSSPDEGNWVEESDFEGSTRSGAVGFVINDLGYVGTGFDGDDRLADFWRFEPNRNSWFRIADFPGRPRNSAVAFSINGIAYVGSGYDGDEELNDFWSYNPGNDTWTRIADLPGNARRGAVSFVLNNEGYVGTGNDGDNNLKDFYRYSPDQDAWTRIASLGGSKRQGAFAFVIDNIPYVGGGIHNGIYQEDFWAYNPNIDGWEKRNDLDDDDTGDASVLREYAAAFSVNGYGFLTLGSRPSSLIDTWRYDPMRDEWVEVTEFEGAPREQAVTFTLVDVAYITTGRNVNTRFDDIWSFFSLEEFDEDD